MKWIVLACGLVCATDATNPFAGGKFYVNPANQKEFDGSIATATGKVHDSLKDMRDVPSAYWIDKKDKIKATSANDTSSLEGILKDAASKPTPPLVVVIWYDLPNRDCDAKASNGEICCTKGADGRCDYETESDCADGISEYKTGYADLFVSVLAEYKGKVPIVVIVEPDSLPNLATNIGHPHCGNKATQTAYKTGIAYAVEQITTKTDATVYLDAAHGGWLGWSDNLQKYLSLLKDMNLPFDKMRGFATNVANYQPLGIMCPWAPDQGYRNAYCLNNQHADAPCCADPCKLESQWNAGNNELNYAQMLAKAANGTLAWNVQIIIDTGRNGVSDMRKECSNWCNARGAGAGVHSTAETGHDLIDAYFWLKTPGESDGCTQILPDGKPCPRYDSMCGSVDSIGSQSSEPRAPEAGAWFDYQVKQLAANAANPKPPTPPYFPQVV
jgi:cellulose 1,4-beta-cellobiosidase